MTLTQQLNDILARYDGASAEGRMPAREKAVEELTALIGVVALAMLHGGSGDIGMPGATDRPVNAIAGQDLRGAKGGA